MNDAQFGRGADTRIDPEAGEEMFADLGRFETGAIPVDAVLRRGRTIRVRRRAVGGAALALAAAVAIGVPATLMGGGDSGYAAASGGSRTYGASATGGRVAVNPTPFSHGKGRFSGTVDGKPWTVDFDNTHCYYILWACGFQDTDSWDQYATLALNSTEGSNDDYTLFLKKNVAWVAVTLQDGEVLHLEAVPVADTPAVLFALPPAFAISRINLYDAQGSEIAFTIPFSVKGSRSVTGNWYKPGQVPPAKTETLQLASGDIGPGHVVMTAYAGPSGPCIVTVSDGAHPEPGCAELMTLTGSAPVIHSVMTDAAGHSTAHEQVLQSGLVAPNIDHLRLTLSDGTVSTVAIKSIGGYRFFADIVPEDKNVTALTAYDAAGKALPVEKNYR